LEQGPTEKAIIHSAARDRQPLPERIQNAPDLLLGLEIYYLAFLDFTSCRTAGYGTEGPISWMTIEDYADRKGIEGAQREDLHYYISNMDAAYLEFKSTKLSNSLKQPPKPPAKKGKR
jgi:hypothetical protein